MQRHVGIYTKNNEKDYQNWMTHVANQELFYLLYRTTQINHFAFSNEFGGYGTQLFFMTLKEELKTIKKLVLKTWHQSL